MSYFMSHDPYITHQVLLHIAGSINAGFLDRFEDTCPGSIFTNETRPYIVIGKNVQSNPLHNPQVPAQ